ncbi:MAG: hypothetical protein AB7I96_15190 [Candidatus Dadabacteria bacterium]
MKTLLCLILMTAITTPAWAHGDSNTDGHNDGHGHEHTAPHGGTLIVLGDEFAHLELVLDPEEGTLRGYVLDGEAESPVRIEQREIEIRIAVPDPGGNVPASELPLRLSAVYNILTGEKEGDTSEFAVRSERLKGMKQFGAVITAITIKGREFEEVEFRFPEGNE